MGEGTVGRQYWLLGVFFLTFPSKYFMIGLVRWGMLASSETGRFSPDLWLG